MTLIHESHYVAGRQDGKAVGYHPNGTIKYVGTYAMGRRIGCWKWYNAAGEVELETDEDEE